MYLPKVNRRKTLKKLVFCRHLEGQWRKCQDPDPGFGSISQRHGSADPDPHQNVMDQEHCKVNPTHPTSSGWAKSGCSSFPWYHRGRNNLRPHGQPTTWNHRAAPCDWPSACPCRSWRSRSSACPPGQGKSKGWNNEKFRNELGLRIHV